MKKFLKWLVGIILLLFLIAISLVGPINRTPLEDQRGYQTMMKELDTLTLRHYLPTHGLKIGWSEANITPSYPMPMAGYKPRPKFEAVHDSLFTKILAIDNGSITCYFLSSDLLLFPPSLRDRIEQKWKALNQGNYFLYFSATHTHNGVGGWHESILGKLALGDYHEEWVEQVAQAIVQEMTVANDSKLNAGISYFENDASEWMENRIAFDNGKVDGKVRGFSIERSDGSKGVAFTFGAHATTMRKESLELSGDYPSETIRQLKSKGWNFGMFMSGMVGSHRFKWMPQNDHEAIVKETEILVNKISTARFDAKVDSLEITTRHVPIQFMPSQLRIDKNWKVRDWVFGGLVAPLQGEITYLAIGDFIFMGTPCDFSGEIFVEENFIKWEVESKKHLLITSFNGDYVGYITYDPHYETLSKDEVMTMNWVGPYNGKYFSTIIRKLLEKN
jgi:neutral ceramidase